MAVHTILKKKEILNFLENYQLDSMLSFEGISEGIENTNYLIKTKSKYYILTLYEKRIKSTDLPFYQSLMIHSKKKGIKCPTPILSKSNKTILKLKSKQTSLFTFLEGSCLEKWNIKHCYKIGQVLARLHKINKKFFMKKENDLSLNSWKQLFIQCKKGMEKISPSSKSILNKELIFLKKNWPIKLPKGIIHADLFPDNVLFINNNVTGVLDFYFSCYDFFIYDLAITLNAWCFINDKFKKEFFMSMLNGYQNIRKLSINEKKNLNICLRGACVRFFFTRMYDKIFSKQKKIYIKKHPNEYLKKLSFHIQNKINKELVFE